MREEIVIMPNKCPCEIADKPCSPCCTCVSGGSSHGCICCCSYGSEEQRKGAANYLVKQSQMVVELNEFLNHRLVSKINLKNGVEIPMTLKERVEWILRIRNER